MDGIQKRQIRKFELYGFLKNLKFFEPFLIVYLFSFEISLFQIGLLYSIREVIIYSFEIPSGVLADRFGKKNELILCFIFYIFSFTLFFIGGPYYIFVIGFVLYGFGEAFRSGTHKALIMDYLDYETLSVSKSEIYGKTRSRSLQGSMVSSFLAIIFVFVLPEIKYLFLIAIIPYLVDILLIISYPKYMNKRLDTTFSFKKFLKDNVDSVVYSLKDKEMRGLLYSSSTYNAWFKSVKDYVQPILVMMTVSFVVISGITEDETVLIYLAVLYMVIFFISSLGSKYAYRFKPFMTEESITTYIWIPSAILMLTLGLFIENIVVVIIVFILFYLIFNIRKPLMIELIGDVCEKDKRSSVLSIESQLTSLFIIVMAPLFGYLSDTYSIAMMFILFSSAILVFEVGKLLTRKNV
jgi:MFS family permease